MNEAILKIITILTSAPHFNQMTRINVRAQLARFQPETETQAEAIRLLTQGVSSGKPLGWGSHAGLVGADWDRLLELRTELGARPLDALGKAFRAMGTPIAIAHGERGEFKPFGAQQ